MATKDEEGEVWMHGCKSGEEVDECRRQEKGAEPLCTNLRMKKGCHYMITNLVL